MRSCQLSGRNQRRPRRVGGLAAADRVIALLLGHLVLGHGGLSLAQTKIRPI